MHHLRTGLDGLTSALTWFAGLLTVVMMVHVTADVAARNFLNSPIVGTTEIVSAYYMAALAFLPLALITRERGHIIVELFTGWMKRPGRTLLDGIVAVLSLVYVVTFTWGVTAIAIEKTAIREAREAGIGLIYIWPSRWVVPIGFGLMAAYLLIYIVRDFRSVATGEYHAEEQTGFGGGQAIDIPPEGKAL
jgi:TRAP-type C4-dicarboxylate transport system permease small subunit